MSVAISLIFVLLPLVQAFFLLVNWEVAWSPQILTNITSLMIIAASLVRRSGRAGFFAFGVMTALLRCMTLASALTAAAMTGNGIDGAFVMLGFVLGTRPVMLITPALAGDVSSWVAAHVPVNTLRRVAGVFLILAAGMTLLRVMT